MSKLQTTLDHIKPVSLDHFQRLINHGPTVLVSAQCPDTKVINVMSAAWACVLDFAPNSKITVVLDKSTETRKYIENGHKFVLSIPCVELLNETDYLGGVHRYEEKDKLEKAGTIVFPHDQYDLSYPLVAGCVGWIICDLIPLESNHQDHDLFIGKVLAAYADDRAYNNNRWITSSTNNPNLRTIHHIAGGNYFVTGDILSVESRTQEKKDEVITESNE